MLIERLRRRADLLLGLGLFIGALALYVCTLAPGLSFGDPAEYTFIPHIWGVIHPPGYAFQTVLGGLWQRLAPIGTIAYRANLLSAVAGAAIAALVYGAIRALTPPEWEGKLLYLPALFGGASAAVATDLWQHSLHANAHIITALLATLSLFLLLRWWRERKRGWLFAFCAVAGLSVTHHPLLIFSFPAYLVFILVTEPRIVLAWRTLLGMVGFGLLGLSVWLYFPIRASLPPVPFGPDTMNTLDGFMSLVMARGLRVNLFPFSLAEQPDRALIFWTLLRLQYSLPVIVLMAMGFIALARRAWRVALLYGLFLAVNLGFILNTIQDVMAYLMAPFAALAALAGVGALMVMHGAGLLRRRSHLTMAVLAVLLAAPPISRVVTITPCVSLREWHEAEAWIAHVYDRFEGQGEGAVLLADWEHLTPLWYEEYVDGRPLDPDDVQLVYVATTSERPWVDNVWAHIEEGPVYVTGYRREIVDEGFRLRASGRWLYRVLLPPAVEAPEEMTPLGAQAGLVTVVGYALERRDASPGDVIPLTLYLRADETPADIIFPYTVLGEMHFDYTTDSHWLSPWWEPGEIIGERYDLRLPLDAAEGEYPLALGLRNLSRGEALTFDDGGSRLSLGSITVTGEPTPLPDDLMADIAHRIGLVRATASAGGQHREAIWEEPLVVHPGDTIHVVITWEALAPPDDNWKVFVHLIDPATNQPIAQQDNPPLGGAFPTFLWFPKWVAGQTVMDPYRIQVPPDAPPGEYWLEVGMYGFTSLQRVPLFDSEGNLTGDRFILGTVRVDEPAQ
jgi:hypothetical protein